MRIHKALADAGVASRRKSEEMVAAGRVHVNGVIAAIGQQVDVSTDVLTLDGRAIGQQREERLYMVMAKPYGTTSTVSDPHALETVLDLVPAAMRDGASRLYPVGRLDRESEGLLLLTNDGSWAQRMLHPSHGIEREYAVGLDHSIDDHQRRELEGGIRFEEGMARLAHLAPATNADLRRLVELLGAEARDLVWYRATLRQGMKRQLRRMFGAVEAPVRRLVRLRFGTIRLSGMSIGDVRPLTATERRQLDALVTRGDGGGIGEGRAPAKAEPRAQAEPRVQAESRTRRDGRGLVVSIDGPGGSGKSTVGAGAAEKVSYRFCDTGVLYRGLTWLALERAVDTSDAAALSGLVEALELAPDARQRYVRVVVDGRDITERLHTPEVDREVSGVSRHSEVRAKLLPLQHALASGGRIVMAGRDIGTVVLPDADLKVYLDVSIAERARRRAEARGVADDSEAVTQIEQELRKRDGVDSTRETAPLRVPEGALVINTEGNTLEQTIDDVVTALRRREHELGSRR